MILLSILIPSLPERMDSLRELLACIPNDPRIEILVLTDNRRRHVGAKRNAMMAMAQGQYAMHVDDDDLLAPGLSEKLLPELEHGVDVVGFDASVSFNGGPEFRVTTSLHGPNQQPHDLGGGRYSDITRTFWHWSAWRTDFARQFKFPEEFGWTEDAFFLEQALPAVRSHRKADWVGYRHRWNAARTEFKPAS